MNRLRAGEEAILRSMPMSLEEEKSEGGLKV